MNTVKKTRKVAGGVTGKKGQWLVPVINEEIEVSTDKFVKYYPVEALKLLRECTGTERVVIDILMSQIENGSVITLDSEVKGAIKEILDITDVTVTRIISSLKKKNILRHYRDTLFMLNPEIVFVGTDIERVEARSTFNSLDPASNMRGCNLSEARKQRRSVKAKENGGNTGENEGKGGDNKSNNEGKDLRGEPKTIVHHPEAEVIAQVQGYNPVVEKLGTGPGGRIVTKTGNKRQEAVMQKFYETFDND